MAFKRIYPEARFSLWDFLRLSTANIASDLYHAARQGVLWHNVGSIFWFRLMQFWGTYRGYRTAQAPLTDRLRQTFYYPRGLRPESPTPREGVEPIRYD
jgi:hypothetical protein